MNLVKYEAARTALAEAHRVDEVKDIRDKAEAMAAYARQANDIQLIRMATEIKVRAERRCGELTRTIEKRQGNFLHDERNGKAKGDVLSDAGITWVDAHRYEKLAAMPEEHFETAIATAQAATGQVSTAYMLRVAKELETNSQMRREIEQMKKQNFWKYVRDHLARARESVSMADEPDAPECHHEIAAEIVRDLAYINRLIGEHIGVTA